MRRIAVLFLIPLLFFTLAADSPKDFQTKLAAARNERNYTAAIAELLKFRKQEPILFSVNNYDYLLARIAEQNGDFPLAMTYYQAVIFRKSVLREYAIWHLSQMAHSTGNLTQERLYLLEIRTLFPESLLANAARIRTAESLFESSEFDRVLAEMKPNAPNLRGTDAIAVKAGKSRQRLELINNVLIGKSLIYTDEKVRAREIFEGLVNKSNPDLRGDFALEGVRGLDLLEAGSKNYGDDAVEIADQEHLRRADIYQLNREFEMARFNYLAIVNRHASDDFVPNAIFGIGLGYSRQRDFAKAVGWFERLLEQYPEHELAGEGLLQAASAYARVGKFRESVSRYQKFIEKYPNDARIGRANLNAAAVLRDNGEQTEALRFAAAAGKSAAPIDAARGLFTETRIYLARDSWSEALEAIDRLLQIPLDGVGGQPDGTNPPEVTFLRGLILEQLRRYDDAITSYLSLPDGREEYYGGLATLRLRSLGGNQAAAESISSKRNELLIKAESRDREIRRQSLQSLLRMATSADEQKRLIADLKKTYAEIPAYAKLPLLKSAAFGRKALRSTEPRAVGSNRHTAIANELAFLSLFDEAAPEYEASLQKAASNRPDTDTEISYSYLLGGLPTRSIALLAPKWQKVSADFQIELLPPDAIRVMYPTPYSDELLRFSKKYGVDPRFLLAIMRQESRFRPDARSSAAARGLMQFINETGAKIAVETGRTSFRPDDLYDPGTSIQFAAKYVSDLFKLFPNQPEAVAAAYNGGEDNIKRWLGRANSNLPGGFVPEIAFGQTKEYVYSVMANYRVYATFYDENLNLK